MSNNNKTATKPGYHLYYEVLETGFTGSSGIYADKKRAEQLSKTYENAIVLANGSLVEVEERMHYWVKDVTVPADFAFVQ